MMTEYNFCVNYPFKKNSLVVICESLKGDLDKEEQSKMSVERCEVEDTRKRDEPVTLGCKNKNRWCDNKFTETRDQSRADPQHELERGCHLLRVNTVPESATNDPVPSRRSVWENQSPLPLLWVCACLKIEFSRDGNSHPLTLVSVQMWKTQKQMFCKMYRVLFYFL